MPKVYVLNRGGHDYSDAERFGTVTYCSEGMIPKFNTSHMVRIFQQAFIGSQAEDYILLTSLSTMCSIACAIFAHKHGRLNLLIHQAGNEGGGNRYVERVVQLGDRNGKATVPISTSRDKEVRGKRPAR